MKKATNIPRTYEENIKYWTSKNHTFKLNFKSHWSTVVELHLLPKTHKWMEKLTGYSLISNRESPVVHLLQSLSYSDPPQQIFYYNSSPLFWKTECTCHDMQKRLDLFLKELQNQDLRKQESIGKISNWVETNASAQSPF